MQISVYEDHSTQDAVFVQQTFEFNVNDQQMLLKEINKALSTEDSTGFSNMKFLHILQNVFQTQNTRSKKVSRGQAKTSKNNLLDEMELVSKRTAILSNGVDDSVPSHPMPSGGLIYTTSCQQLKIDKNWEDKQPELNKSVLDSNLSIATSCCSCKCHIPSSKSAPHLADILTRADKKNKNETDFSEIQNSENSEPSQLHTEDNLDPNIEQSATSNPNVEPPSSLSALLQHQAANYASELNSENLINDCSENVKLPSWPRPGSKMRSVNWQKLPPQAILGKEKNLWKQVLTQLSESGESSLDFNTVEEYFKQKQDTSDVPAGLNGESDQNDSSMGPGGTEQQNSSFASPVRILDERKALSVNVFIKQFRCSHGEVLGKIRRADGGSIGAERLRQLIKLLPNTKELELLRSYSGDKNKLDDAEKFLKLLVSLPHYDLRLESMLIKESYDEKCSTIQSAIDALKLASQEVIDNRPLCDLLSVILIVGNFLNQGGYAGNALGVKLESLTQVLDSKTNHYSRKLRHVVAEEALRRNGQINNLRSTMPSVFKAARESLENISEEVASISEKTISVLDRISMSTSFVKEQFSASLQEMKRTCDMWLGEIDELRIREREVLDYFCEGGGVGGTASRLEHILVNIDSIIDKIETSIKENELLQLREQQKREREVNKQKCYSASYSMLESDTPSSSSCSDLNNDRLRMTNAELQSALMKQKTELQKTSGGSSGRRRYHHNHHHHHHHHQHHTQQQQIKHSSTFSHFPPADRSTFSSEDASCEDVNRSPNGDMYNVLLKETPHRPGSHPKHPHSSSAALSEIKNARKEQIRRNRERRKREIQILTQAALKQLTTEKEDEAFLGFANHNIDTDNNIELGEVSSEQIFQQGSSRFETSPEKSSLYPSDNTRGDTYAIGNPSLREVSSAPEGEKSNIKVESSAHCASAPESSANDQNLKPALQNFPVRNYKSQHSVEEIQLATKAMISDQSPKSAVQDSTSKLNTKNSEHDSKIEDSSCTSSDFQSEEDSSELSSDEATIIENSGPAKVDAAKK